MAAERSVAGGFRRRLRDLGRTLLLAAAALVAVEGLASVALFVWDVAATPRVGESYHTQYDAELGWVNQKGVRRPDMYGPGRGLTTNARGFRGSHEVEPAVPPGRIRVVCSGDSFTLGYGVADDETWCALLAAIDSRLEPVNMGQGGYGLDQVYLWWKRDARELAHQVHVVAFISDDFERVRDLERLGYGKPFLDLDGSTLVVRNVPVPRRAWIAPWVTRHLGSLQALRSFELLRRLLGSGRAAAPEKARAAVRPVVAKLLEDLQRLDREKGSALVLVYLPYLPEHDSPTPPGWLRFLRGESERLGLPLVDLADACRSLPRAEAEALFIPEGPGTFPGAGGHLSVRGNRWVAEELYRRLQELPQLR